MSIKSGNLMEIYNILSYHRVVTWDEKNKLLECYCAWVSSNQDITKNTHEDLHRKHVAAIIEDSLFVAVRKRNTYREVE